RKRRQRKTRVSWRLRRSITRKDGTDEALEILRRAGRLCPPPGRGRHPGRGCVPADGSRRGHVLHLEEEVRASGRERAPPPAAARGRKRPIEASGRRPHARQTHADGGAPKKRLRPARRRELAGWFQGTFEVSCARACRLAQFSRAAWYRRSRARDQSALRLRTRGLAHARRRFGAL